MLLVPRQRVLGATLAVALGLVLVPPPAHADTTDTTLSIPAPTGSHHVDATALYLRGTSRTDPLLVLSPGYTGQRS
jgi:hypothetical protein